MGGGVSMDGGVSVVMSLVEGDVDGPSVGGGGAVVGGVDVVVSFDGGGL